jgi:hypothetical protein
MKKQTLILILSTLTVLASCTGSGAASSASTPVLTPEDGTAKLKAVLKTIPTTKALGVELKNLACDISAYDTPSPSESSSASTSASTSTSTASTEIGHLKVVNGSIKAAIKGLDATKVADLSAQASLNFDEVDYGIVIKKFKDTFDAKPVQANAYLANGNAYLDMENQATATLAQHLMIDVVMFINSLSNSSSGLALSSLFAPSFAASTSETFTPVKVAYNGVIDDKSLPIWSTDNTTKYSDGVDEGATYILGHNDVFSFSYDAAGNGVMAVTLTKESLKSLVHEGMAKEASSSSASTSVDYTQADTVIDALTINELSGKLVFSDSAILSASWNVDAALPENDKIAGKGTLKMSGEAAFTYGSDVSVTLPDDLASYKSLN